MIGMLSCLMATIKIEIVHVQFLPYLKDEAYLVIRNMLKYLNFLC